MYITKEQIQSFLQDDLLYEQGKVLVEQKAIVSFETDEHSDFDFQYIHATFQVQKTYYEVNISIHKVDKIIAGYHCTCKEYAQSKLPCVHCSAALSHIFDQTKHNIPKERVLQSDDIVQEILQSYEDMQYKEILASHHSQKVHLIPTLVIDSSFTPYLTLKISHPTAYQIKNMSLFLENLKKQNTYTYSKKMTLFHHIQCFDSQSQELVSLLMKYVDQHESQNHSSSQNRYFSLSPHAFDAFFDLYENETISLQTEEGSFPFVCKKENPPFTILCSQDQDVYHISLMEQDFCILKGIEYPYILLHQTLYRCDKSFLQYAVPFLQSYLHSANTWTLTAKDMLRFYQNILLKCPDTITYKGIDFTKLTPIPLINKLYLDFPSSHCLSVKLIHTYDDQEFNAFHQVRHSTIRNYAEEMNIRLLVEKYMTHIDNTQGIASIENNQDALFTFLQTGLPTLSSYAQVYTTKRFQQLRIKESFPISFGVRLESNLLHFHIDFNDFPIDELQAVLQAYQLHKKYYRMRNGDFLNIEQSSLSELADLLKNLQVTPKELSQGKWERNAFQALYLDQCLQETKHLFVQTNTDFSTMIEQITHFKKQTYSLPPHLTPILREYQKEGFQWLKTLSQHGLHCLLADDMGIGKTLQIIALLESEYQTKTKLPSIVVCPSSLILNWGHELDKFSKHIRYCIINGTSKQRQHQIEKCHQYHLIITSYDYLKRDITEYASTSFSYCILDESQYIKNPTTQNAKAVKQLHADHRIALTGTPIENALSELWSIFDFLMPSYLFSYPEFYNQFEKPIIKEQDEEAMEILKKRIQPFFLRRLKKDVLKELPDKIEQTLFIQLDKETRKLYMANVASMHQELHQHLQQNDLSRSRMMILSMLTRLRQLCCDPKLLYENYPTIGAKLHTCLELIQQCIQTNKKVLIFSQFTSLLHLLEPHLKKQQIPYYILEGSTLKQQRQQMVDKFQIDDTPVFLISLKAGGTGLNLTRAEVVIHFDPWWNLSAQHQASDRAYRIGQYHNVQIYKLIAKDTIEEKILHLQEQKANLGDTLMQRNENILSSM
ncbi:MAG: SNF2 helicase associated domain-containing protein, partial [Erysipelotrichaceae bacterium]|nr:SNF2 helicase associated domain-containing protein [Erysipelotrichaceae bacterium]